MTRVDALRRIEHAGAADDQVLGGCVFARRASRHLVDLGGGLDRDRAVGEQVVEHGHPRDEPGAHLASRSARRPRRRRRGSISTPRFIGPGCITFWPGRRRSGVTPQRAAYSRSAGHVVRALQHPLALHAQDVDDVGGADRVDVDRRLAAERLDPARDQRRRARRA